MHSVLSVISLFNRLASTPFSIDSNEKIKRGAFADLVAKTVAPSDYTTADAYLSDAQVSALVRKLKGLPTGIDLVGAAKKAFFEAESQCKNTNARLAFWVNQRERGFCSEDPLDNRMWDFIVSVRKRISSVLGPLPRDLNMRFGSGATYGDRGKKITICHKMASFPTVTPRAVAYLDLVRPTLWWLATDRAPLVVEGNRFTTVPKDSEKDRGIAVEPSVNVSLQLAVGTHLRQQLYKVGIEIDGTGSRNAQSIHRDLARDGSLSGELATIDLSSASDTVCTNLVKLLLPTRWFELLFDLRSPSTLIDGTWIKNEKFSSMGNGFTFELETLLFWALSSEVAGWSKVYGDDIIVPASTFVDVTACLGFFGFTPNKKKSFNVGPFRESCGGDYFLGVDVRPTFIKSVPTNPYEWITFHNLIMSAASKINLDAKDTRRLSRAVVQNIPTWARKYGPSHLGGCLHTDDRSLWEIRAKHGITEVRVLQPVPRRTHLRYFTGGVQLASAILGAPSNGVPNRGSAAGWKKGWVSIS